MQRLGRNHDGYHGETIDIDAVLRDVLAAAQRHGWTVERLSARLGVELLALRRTPTPTRRRLYLSTGIHGDEPAGPLAVRQLLQDDPWPADLALWLCPCLNPTGFALNRRENDQGFDLNRQYHRPQAGEVAAHIAWLDRQPGFDLALCLHEDWEARGFYLYELNPDGAPTHAQAIIRRVAAVCPIDPSETIDGRPAAGGIIRPSADPRSRPEWPEAFYLVQHKTRHSYTLEAPSDFPLHVRVTALTTAVRTVLETF
jgi:predicted deacylase